MTSVRLMALDSEDLDVLAAHMQDAVLKEGDLQYDAKARQFALVANRFVWEEAEGRRQRSFERRRAAMHFDRVLSVRSRGIRRNDPEQVLSLLTVQFLAEEGMDAPSGVIELMCHPGYRPEAVRSGYSAQREVELDTFLHPGARKALERAGVAPADFRVLTATP